MKILFKKAVSLAVLAALMTAGPFPLSLHADTKKIKKPKKKETVKVFPEFGKKAEWLNTKPLTRKFFTNKVTLVYFWDYTSINCIRELKTLKTWADYYRPYRFQILWVHAPEFSAASDLKNLKEAVSKFSLSGPVLADNQFKLWEALQIKSWPTKVLVDEKGRVISMQGGEGEYFSMESQIRTALKNLDSNTVLPPSVYTENLKAYNPEYCGEMTSETYFGYRKSNWWGAKLGNNQLMGEDETRLLRDRGERPERGFFLEGLWANRSEYLELMRENQERKDYAGMLYQGREVYVTAEGLSEDARVYVTRDGEPVPIGFHGQDLRVDEKGETYFSVSSPKLYYLIQGEDAEAHELKLHPISRDIRLYAVSFSNFCLTDFERL